MVKRTYDLPEEEPSEYKNDLPSERNHLLQVVEVFTCEDEIGRKLNLDENTVSVKCESVGGNEEGRSLLHRLTLDENNRGFFATRLFLKAIGMPHKGKVEIDTDMWIGEQFSAFVVHNKASNGKVYANIDTYNPSDGSYDPSKIPDPKPIKEEEIEWDKDIK